MHAAFHAGNRARLYQALPEDALLVLFSGTEKRKTNDEYYPFFTDRNFYYLTGLDSKEFVLLACKDETGHVSERIYILPPDPMAERWTGRRIKPAQAQLLSGIDDVRFVGAFDRDFHALAQSGKFETLFLDLFRAEHIDLEITPAQRFAQKAREQYVYLTVKNAQPRTNFVLDGHWYADYVSDFK